MDRRQFGKLVAAAAAGWALRSHAVPANGKRRNIVLIVSDQHRRSACGCFGAKMRRKDGSSPTPAIDALAAAGVAFSAAYCPAPLCAPSRAAYMSGVYPNASTVLTHRMLGREAGLSRFPGVRGDLPGMGHYFREAGYRTATVGKVHVHGEMKSGWDLGFDFRAYRFYTRYPGAEYADLKDGDTNRRYRQLPPYAKKTYREIDPVKYRDAPAGLVVENNAINQGFVETLVESEPEMFDHLVADCSLSFIEECHRHEQPFLIHVGLEKPHDPWTVHRRYLDLFDPGQIELPSNWREWEERGMTPSRMLELHRDLQPDDARRASAAYFACAASMDEQVGRIVGRCRELGLGDNTLFVYTSDHGEMLFDHGLIYKHNMYEEAVAVPLVMAAPGLPRDVRSKAPASLLDLIPTFLDYAGLPSAPELAGQSLLPVALHPEAVDESRILYSEFYQNGTAAWGLRFLPTRMAREGALKYIYAHGLIDELYNRKIDPQEAVNLALDPKWDDSRSRLRFLCLRDWKLDEHPQFSLRGTAGRSGIELAWDSPGDVTGYEVWREAGPETAIRLAALPAQDAFVDTTARTGTTYRYWVVAVYRFALPFTDNRGKSRYGSTPVMTANYPAYLPVTPALTIKYTSGESADAIYRPWYGLSWGNQQWIFEGMPPAQEGARLRCESPCCLLSPVERSTDVDWKFGIQLAPDPKPVDELVSIFFARRGSDDSVEIAIGGDGKTTLYRRNGPQRRVLAVAQDNLALGAGALAVALRAQGRNVLLSVGDRMVLNWTAKKEWGAGRYGVEAPVGSPRFTLTA